MAVDVERRGYAALLTLNEPAKLNAFSTGQLQALLDAVSGVAIDADVRCVVLTGAGDKAFAAGADISEMASMGQREALNFARLGHAAAAAIEGLPQPVIAAINGYALGGGCEIALACDIRLAAETAQLGQPEVGLGVPPGWGGTQRLPRLVGPGIAAELIYSGRWIKADEALRIGLVNAVHPADQLLPAALDLADRIAANSPRAVQASKRLIALALSGAGAAGLAAEALVFAQGFASDDQREGMAAFLEKRKPTFAGG